MFARRAREAREAARLSQRQVAELMTSSGFPWRQTTVSKVEAETRSVSVGELSALAGHLGQDIGDMLSPVDDTLLDFELLEARARLADAERRFKRATSERASAQQDIERWREAAQTLYGIRRDLEEDQ
jgi:transcriptional regulator with XRE-family HTH domain